MYLRPLRRPSRAELVASLWTRSAVLRRCCHRTRSATGAVLSLAAEHAAHVVELVSRACRSHARQSWDRIHGKALAAFPDPRLAGLATVVFVAVLVVGSAGVVLAAVRTSMESATASATVTASARGAPGTPRPATPPPDLAAMPAAAPTPPELAPEPEPERPRRGGALPVGKGMWIWQPERVEGGDLDALVSRAVQSGLTHLYVRTGSSKSGFHGGPFLEAVLPRAHAAGLRVYGWDFPYLFDPADDARRGAHAAAYTTAEGHRIDGFVADVETRREGVNLTPIGAFEYGRLLREAVGPEYRLVVAVPRPNPALVSYPFPEVVAHFDAIAPMVYWLNRQPEEVGPAVSFLSSFGKPVIPIGQAYDGALEGGRPGPPPPDEIRRFLAVAEQAGAIGASFWSWQHADQGVWDAIATAAEFTLPTPGAQPAALHPGQVRAIQALLTSFGHTVPITGAWGPQSDTALRAYQAEARLPRTGVLDAHSLDFLLSPLTARR